MVDSVTAAIAPGGHSIPGSSLSSDRILYRAVVAEVVSDPLFFNENFKDSIYAEGAKWEIRNPQYVPRAPRNSLIVRIVSEGKDKSEQPLIVFPFFPPHIMMPVKAGEQVWIISEKISTISVCPFWINRVSGWNTYDDINYTHDDRKQVVIEDLTTSEKIDIINDVEESDKTIPEFPNGGGNPSNTTLRVPEKENGDPIEDADLSDSYTYILENSTAQKYFVGESVPRFSKRPSDLALQGSNNTLICLGRDRGWKVGESFGNATESNLSVGAVGQEGLGTGTIDIVCGRSRYMPSKPADEKIDGDPPLSTSPPIIENSREYIEVDKNPGSRELKHNPVEGDPDFSFDSSRIYISMKTDGDSNFGLSYPDVPKSGDGSNTGNPVPGVSGASYIIDKADEIRIIARNQPEGSPYPETPAINGSIKIIKEGVADDESGGGRAVIIIQPDGTIMIDGPKIVLGSGIEKANGEGNQLSIGLGASEPLVLGNELKDLLEKYFNDMKKHFQQVFDTHVHPTGTGPSSPPTSPSTEAQAACDAAIGDLINTLSKVGKTK